MKLNRLSIINYKNIRACELDFSSKLNCFIGNNGMGKTNLLDAVYYLSFCKSHTNPIDAQVINYNDNYCMLKGFYELDTNPETVSCSLKHHQRKQFRHNKQVYEKLADHIGRLPLVLVSPADIAVINDGSDERRRFLDTLISQYDKEYLNNLIRYNKALSNRNSLLKNEQTDPLMFDIYEEEMSNCGNVIFNKRTKFIDEFIPIFQHYHQYISKENELVDLKYQSQLQQYDLHEQLIRTRERDKAIGFTTHGIHKDDLLMLLDKHQIKKTGSQGQNKTYIIALKFAQFDLLKKQKKIKPILLLDDIFDKLDQKRVTQIIKLVSSTNFGQIFITDTNSQHLDEILSETHQPCRFFSIEQGQVTETKTLDNQTI